MSDGIGTAIRDCEIKTADGERGQLSMLWSQRPLVLVFLPPFGSPFCVDNATQLRDAAEVFAEAGATLAAVSTASLEKTAALQAERNLPYIMLCEPSRELYEAFELRPPAEDVAAATGSFVVNTDGTISHAYRGANAADYPPTSILVDAVCALTGVVIERPEPAHDDEFSEVISMDTTADRGSYACPKCQYTDYETGQMATASGILSRVFNFQHRKFTTVTCRRCSYTEMYKVDAGKLGHVFDLLAGG